ncbi:M24 family metallopeptidase [Bacillus sp. SCS-151]|uniref:M24 family metallopeptidase n=1 Tax=Nanhaiella sioensis TaxID=3115293 RepID=UPI00397BD457
MDKLKELRKLLLELNVDGLLITSAQNRRYITGFTGSAGVVLISANEAKLHVDFRYVEQATKQAIGFDIVKHKSNTINEIANSVSVQSELIGIKKLGFEQEHLSFGAFKTYEETLSSQLVPTSGIIEKLRMIKTDEEIDTIKTAAKIADGAFNHILEFIRPGISEKEIANELELFMRKQGADSSSFDTIVASGYRSAFPHGVATPKIIEYGEMVTLDFGALYKGYRSDITRTIAMGEPDEQLKEIYSIVKEALSLGVKGMKSGLSCKAGDKIVRDYITERGYGEYFGHGTGHGLGLDLHELPFLSAVADHVLQPNMVITVEPGIYIPHLGGVRIEDDIVITDNGSERLTHSTRELVFI